MLIAIGLGEVLILSAGSAVLLVWGAEHLSLAEFATLSVGLSGQAIVNVIVRAACTEPALFASTSRSAMNLYRSGIAGASGGALLLLAQMLIMGLTPAIASMLAGWTIAYFLIDFARYLAPTVRERHLVARLFVDSVTGCLLTTSLILVFLDIPPEVSQYVWVAAIVVASCGAVVVGEVSIRATDSTRIGVATAPRGRFVVDAVMLQANVQLAAWVVGAFGFPEFAAILRVSQLVFIPVSLATTAFQTALLQSLVATHGRRRIVTADVVPWIGLGLLALMPAVLAIPSVAFAAESVLPENLAVFIPYAGLLSAIKFADVTTNFAVTALRGWEKHVLGSVLRRVWGVSASASVILGAPLLGIRGAYVALATVAIGMAAVSLIAVLKLNGSRATGPSEE